MGDTQISLSLPVYVLQMLLFPQCLQCSGLWGRERRIQRMTRTEPLELCQEHCSTRTKRSLDQALLPVLASARNTDGLVLYQLSATSGVCSAHRANTLLHQVVSLLLQSSPTSTRAHPPLMQIPPVDGTGDGECRGAPDAGGGTQMPTGTLLGSERVSASWHRDCVCYQVTK